MANRWGLHCANDDGKNPEAEIQQIIATGVSHFTLLDFQADNVRQLRAASPDGTILVRFYLPNWRTKNPVDWARECAERYLRRRDADGWSLRDMRAAVTPANEQNLAVEGGDDSRQCFEQTAWWNGAWLTEFMALTGIPKELTHWPAWAYGNYDDWDPIEAPRGYTGIAICRGVIHRYGVFDGHPYPHSLAGIADRWDGGRDQIWSEALPDMPIFCSEFCCPDVMAQDAAEYIVRWFRYAETRPAIVGGTVFIVRDPHHSMMNNDLSRNPAIMARIGAEPKPSGGNPVTESELERLSADIFKRASAGWNLTGGICKYWLDSWKAGRYLGAPTGPEHWSESHRYVLQEFASAVLFWDSTTNKVQETLPL